MEWMESFCFIHSFTIEGYVQGQVDIAVRSLGNQVEVRVLKGELNNYTTFSFNISIERTLT